MAIDCGWDIGGVHLKVARLQTGDPGGPRLACRQESFEIWRSPGCLAERLSLLLRAVLPRGGCDNGPAAARHAVTMTAELSDVYPDRAAGVRAILASCGEAFEVPAGSQAPIRVLGTGGDLLTLPRAAEVPHRVAAANWAASAAVAARLVADRPPAKMQASRPGAPATEGIRGLGLLIDVGSTTTDLIPLRDRRADPAGHTDLERLLSGELVYTGLLRTPPAALADRIPLGDRWCRVAPEAFTIMGDAYLLLGRIGSEQYTVPTPDGRGRSREECAARMARLVCSEPGELGEKALLALAAFLEDRQVGIIAEAVQQVRSRRPDEVPLAVVAGAGWFLGAAAARRAGLESSRLSALLPDFEADWDVTAPAAALAILSAEEHGAPLPILPPA